MHVRSNKCTVKPVLTKPWINPTLNKILIQRIFVILTCIYWTPVDSNTKIYDKEVKFRQVSLHIYMLCSQLVLGIMGKIYMLWGL